MKKDLLIKLLKLIKENYMRTGNVLDRDIHFIFKSGNIDDLNILFKLTNAEVEDILGTVTDLFDENKKMIISKIYFYLYQDELNEKVRESVEKAIKEDNPNVYLALRLIGKVPSDDLYEYVNLIINAKGIKQAEYASNSINESLLSRSDAKEIIKLIANAKEEYQAEYASDLTNYEIVLSRKDAKEIFELVVNVGNRYQIEYTRNASIANKILENCFAIDIIKMIATATGEEQSLFALNMAIETDFLNRENALEIIRLISTSPNDTRARNAFYVAKDSGISHKVTSCPTIDLDIVKLIMSTEHFYQADAIYEAAIDPDFLKKDNSEIMEILNLIATAPCEYQCIGASEIVKIPDLIQRDDAKEFIKLIIASKKESQIDDVVDMLQSDLAKRSDAIDFVKLILNIEEAYKSHHAALLASDDDIVKRIDAIEIVKLIATARGPVQADLGHSVAINKNALKRDDAKELISLITNSHDYQSKCGYDLILNTNILTREDATNLLTTVVTTTKETETNDAKRKVINKINGVSTGDDLPSTKRVFPKRLVVLEDSVTVDRLMFTGGITTLIESLEDTDKKDIRPKTKIKVKRK